jgi:glutamyl-tRNA synthetase
LAISRTALLAWLFARSRGGRFLWRFEDLDNAVRPEYYRRQLADVAAMGMDWDGEPIRQSDRTELYQEALQTLRATGLVYPCFCSRREIRDAVSAPHEYLSQGAYPGTCRDLTIAQVAKRSESRRPAALRLRVSDVEVTIVDELLGSHTGYVDDVVLQRGDGTPAYNLVVVVDDADQGVTQVVRADDLLASTPRQIHIARLLGVEPPDYAHVPLVLNSDGQRLAKRDGAVTLGDRIQLGESPIDVLNAILSSLNLGSLDSVDQLPRRAETFDPISLPQTSWIYSP